MLSEHISDETIAIDRLAMSRAQHLKTHNNRPKSVSEDEIDAISDWSESDRECCPLSDFESTSNVDLRNNEILLKNDNQLSREGTFLENILRLNETPLPSINGNTTSRRISLINDTDKSKEKPIQTRTSNTTVKRSSIQIPKPSQQPLLPARRFQNNSTSPRRPTMNSHVLAQPIYNQRYRKTTTNSSRRCSLRRESTFNTISKDSSSSPNTSFHSNDENNQNQQQRLVPSPNLSQISTTNGLMPRVHEMKKSYIDESDYGRLTDVSAIKSIQPRSRQKWGTIVHPPFLLGYQHIAPEQVTQAVERLTSPVRCRDRHTPIQTTPKRYLSVEETDALINRLTKVKPIRTTDEYCSLQNPSRSVKNNLSNALKPNNNWKGVGISA